MKLIKWTACGLLVAAMAVVSCRKEEEKIPDTTPAELKSFALLQADNAGLDKDYAPEMITESMILRVKGGGVGKSFVATLTAGENDEIKVNDAVVPANGKASFDATFPVDIVVTNKNSGLKASYVAKIGKILELVATKIPSYTEAADADHGTAIEVAANPADGCAYIAYNRKLTVDGTAEKNNNLSVARWNGVAYELVGKSGIADNSSRQPILDEFDFGPNGTAYVVHHGEKTSNILGVKQFSGGSWSVLGTDEVGADGTVTTSWGHIDLYFDGGKPGFVVTGNKKNYNQRDAYRLYYDGSAWQANVGISGLPKYGEGTERGSNAGMFYTGSALTTSDAAYVVTSSNWYGYYLFKVQNNSWTKLVEDFMPEGETFGVPSNLTIRKGTDDKIYVFAASGAQAKMQLYTYENNTFVPYANALAYHAGSNSTVADASTFFIRPDGTFVVIRVNSETKLPEFCILDENRQWTEWQNADDVPQYSGFAAAMTTDGTILAAYTSRDEAKVTRIESFTVGMEADILPE